MEKEYNPEDESISIHAPRERSDSTRFVISPDPAMISIHAPRERSDLLYEFRDFHRVISIHAPRERSDAVLIYGVLTSKNFNPRSS